MSGDPVDVLGWIIAGALVLVVVYAVVVAALDGLAIHRDAVAIVTGDHRHTGGHGHGDDDADPDNPGRLVGPVGLGGRPDGVPAVGAPGRHRGPSVTS